MTEVIDPDFPPGKTVPITLKAEGFMNIPVLEFLEGESWTDVTMAYITALRPSAIRFADPNMPDDGIAWRVTVHFDSRKHITEIFQEVMVCLPEGMTKGSELKRALRQQKETPHGIYNQLLCRPEPAVVDRKRIPA